MRAPASVALHEAGHLVTMLAFGLAVESASMVPNANSLGRVTPGKPLPSGEGPPLTTAQVVLLHVAVAVVCLAGAAAERLGGFTPSGLEGDEADADALADRVCDLLGVPACRWRHIAAGQAERYLRENWPAVVNVAAALMAEGTLDEARARELAGDLPTLSLRPVAGALDFWSERRHRETGG